LCGAHRQDPVTVLLGEHPAGTKSGRAIFQAFCEERGESFLPADPRIIRAFIEHEVKAGKKPATVRRYVATIGRAHIGAGLLNPCSGEAVRLALKKMGRETSARQTQARALGSIAPIFKRVAQWIGMPARFVAEISGHSTRVGAAQDLVELDIDLAAITQAGGWKSTRMPLQYAEKINAARSGMARAAAASGRGGQHPEWTTLPCTAKPCSASRITP
jgi:hypothetical protein